MHKTKRTLISCWAVTSLLVAGSAAAFDQGDWLLRFGTAYVNPTSDNHDTVDVEDAWGAAFNLSYMMTDHWSVELLAAWPFTHDISLVGTDEEIASTKQLPPTLSVQYHFLNSGGFQPYVGVGVNYTNFFDEKTTGVLAGTDLSLDSSWGWEVELGADIPFGDSWFVNLDIRYIDIETEAKLDGTSIGKVKIDPVVYGLNLGVRF